MDKQKEMIELISMQELDNFLLKEVPPAIVAKCLDEVLFDYSIQCIRSGEGGEDAANSINVLRRLRDALLSVK